MVKTKLTTGNDLKEISIKEIINGNLFSFDEKKQPDEVRNPILELDEKRASIFRNRINNLIQGLCNGELVYRGSKIELLSEKLCKDYQVSADKDFCLFYSHLFYFGEKARYYFEYNKLDISIPLQEMLFDMLSNQLGKKRQKERVCVHKFCQREKDLATFFADKKNKKHFCEKLYSNIKVLHWYLALSHTLGVLKEHPSRNNSTTKSLSCAVKFACDKKRLQDSNPIILLYALPNEMKNIRLSMKTFSSQNKADTDMEKLLTENGLPFCKTFCYEGQREITVYGALLPHLIWGVYEIKSRRTVVNPHMFCTKNNNDEHPSLFLDIDQDDFEHQLFARTNFENYVSYIPGFCMRDGRGVIIK